MVNSQHLRMLKQDVEKWNQWRQGNPDCISNLSYADLSEVNLNSANLSNANLILVNLNSGALKNANLCLRDR